MFSLGSSVKKIIWSTGTELNLLKRGRENGGGLIRRVDLTTDISTFASRIGAHFTPIIQDGERVLAGESPIKFLSMSQFGAWESRNKGAGWWGTMSVTHWYITLWFKRSRARSNPMTTTNNEYISEKVKNRHTIVTVQKYKSTGYWARENVVLTPNVG